MKYAEIEWRDGQPYSPEYDDIYYSKAGGRSESEYVFLKQNNLAQRWAHAEHFVIAETGFGTGLNFILTLKAWVEDADQNAKLHYIGIEKHPVSPDDIRQLAGLWPDLFEYYEALLSIYPLPIAGVHVRTLFDGRVTVYFQFMDIIAALKKQQFAVDAWYLDGFGPEKNPDLWNEQVFSLLAQNSKTDATLSTYTCAGAVRRGLIHAGFDVSKVSGHGKKREMIIASLQKPGAYISNSPWYDIPVADIKNKSIVIIGSGLAGLSVAWSFVQRGWQVTVIDRHDRAAQEASGNPAGLVMPRVSIDNQQDSMFYSSAFLYAIHCLDKLQKITKEKIWSNEGVYSVTRHGKLGKVINKFHYPESFVKLLPEEDIPEYLCHDTNDVSFYSLAGWASPARICEAMLTACANKLTRLTADVGELKRINDEWHVLNKNGEQVVASNIVVVANGIGVNNIEVTSCFPVTTVRGQMTEVPVSKKSSKIEHALSFDAYVTPAIGGIHYLGASYSVSEKTKNLLRNDQDENISRLKAVAPEVFSPPLELNGRVGFRAVSIDRMPIVGAVPDQQAFKYLYKDLHHGKPATNYESGRYQPGLYVSAAHGSRGMCSCFLSAEVIASMVEKLPLPVNREVADAINPARDLIRDFRRNRQKGL